MKDLEKSDIYLSLTFVFVCVSWISIRVYELFPKRVDVWIFEILNFVLLLINLFLFHVQRKDLKSHGYSTIFKQTIPTIFLIVNYLLLLSIIPALLWISNIFSLILVELYVIELYILVIIYLIVAVIVPFTYSKEFKEKNIGDFYSVFSSNQFCLDKIRQNILDNEKLKIFIRPRYLNSDKNINDDNIINNLKLLKKENRFTYNRLKASIQLKVNSYFWNISSIVVALTAISITLYSQNFFSDLLNMFVTGDNSINIGKFIVETVVGIIFFEGLVGFFKFGSQELNKRYYKEMLMYFEESESEKDK